MHRGVFFFAAAFLVASTFPAVADDPLPDSATIYAKVRAAHGADPSNYKEVLQISQSNGTGWTETRFVSGDNYRYDYSGDSVETQEGEYKGDSWHQNANGLTVVHEPEPGLATKETYTTTVTRITDPVRGYRIANLNKQGWGNVDYVDATAWQIVRSESIDASGTSVQTFGPLVAFGPRKLAKTRHLHDADSGLDSDTTVVSYEAGGVTDADVAIPSNRRTLVQFPAGVDVVNLPATFRNNRIYVMVTINGHGYDFLLDSGSAGINVDPGAVEALGLHVYSKSKNAYNAGAFDTAQAKIDAMSVGPLTMHDVYVHTAPVVEHNDNVKSVGLLGFDFLAELGVKIDYDHKNVQVRRYGTYSQPVGADVNELPIRLDSQTPLVTAKINGAIAERITIDTGADSPFLLFNYFARRHPEAMVDKDGGGARSGYVDFDGVGGTVETKPYELGEIVLGRSRFLDFVGYLVTSKSYLLSDEDGLFGTGFLRFYDVYIDYPNGVISLRLNDTGHRVAGR